MTGGIAAFGVDLDVLEPSAAVGDDTVPDLSVVELVSVRWQLISTFSRTLATPFSTVRQEFDRVCAPYGCEAMVSTRDLDADAYSADTIT